MNHTRQTELFESSSVTAAVMRLAFPTVLGQIILVIYNMADTFYVGLSENDAMLTAVTVCMPAFMFLSAISNLFGVGGASVIARALGAKESDKVRSVTSFALLGCLAVSAAYSVFAYFARDLFVDLLGGTHLAVHRHAVAYLECTVVFGGCITTVSGLLSHLIRSEGRAVHASAGIALGGIMNIVLDPLFMFVLLPPGQEALGAAIATLLSNLISLIYFIVVLFFIRHKTHLGLTFSRSLFLNHIPADVLSSGVPACVMTLFEKISYATLDKLMSLSGIAMQAGIGVAKKVNMLAHCITRGISQGSLPLIAYSFSAKNYARMRKTVRVSHGLAIAASGLCMLISLVFSRQLVGIFIHSRSAALHFGSVFLRILSVGGPFSASAYTVISFFQATGQGGKSFFLATLRKGLVDIPLMFLLSRLIPVFGIVLATPITDILCCLVAQIIFVAEAAEPETVPTSLD